MIPANTISLYRDAITKVLEGLDAARNLELVITSQGGAATMFTAGDFQGANADLSTQFVADAINSRNAIETALAAGHYTNLNRMRA